MKTALVTGVTGQDGSYLAELLINKGYHVYGLVRRSSSFNTGRIDHLLRDYHEKGVHLLRYYGDLTDSSGLQNLIYRLKPDELYNLGAQSHVRISFDIPEYTADTTGLGVLRLLEAVKNFELQTGKKIKFYQASSSEMFGSSLPPQNEKTPFHPRSPYGCAKVFAYHAVVNYRESYNMFAANGILFNHESPRRGGTFVTKKISHGIASIKKGLTDKIYLGNLNARRDWGYAPEYVEAMWTMLQQPEPDDYVIATGETHSVREFVEKAFDCVGVSIGWQGKGLEEKGVDKKTGKVLVEIDPIYFRSAEVEVLQGDAQKAKNKLGWESKTKFGDLVQMMVEADLMALEA
jgi:GDPmannose 4,6-dehydratase